MKKFLAEFKEFAMRGNVMDMAVGVVVGGAFSKIVSSLVNDLVMPLLGLLIGKINFASLAVTFPPAREGADPVVLAYGNFLQTVFEFLVIALCVFCAVRLINKFSHKKEEPAPEPPKGPTSEELLTEIRDLLKENAK